MALTFNEHPPLIGKSIEDPDQRTIKLTPSLWNADWDDASRFGGELTREAMRAVALVGDRRHVTVDTKIHMLMPGMVPAIPGWHTDGIPRAESGSPSGPLEPDFHRQVGLDHVAPRYHLLVTGSHAPTEFLTEPWFWDPPTGRDLYAEMTRSVEDTRQREQGHPGSLRAAPSTVYQWDWWNIHRAIPAEASGWRFLMRVTESDFLEPKTDMRDILRMHNQVYLPSSEYGW